MWLIRIALRRPITIIVLVVALAFSSVLAIMRTRVDIFPNLDLPVIYVAQPYGGMSPQQMEGFVSYYYEYHFLYINGIESVEAKSIQGTALASANLPSRNEHERCACADDLVCESRPSLHASRNGFALRHSLRRGYAAGGIHGLFQSVSDAR